MTSSKVGPNVVVVIPTLPVTVFSDSIFDPPSVNILVVDVLDLVVINPPVVILAPFVVIAFLMVVSFPAGAFSVVVVDPVCSSIVPICAVVDVADFVAINPTVVVVGDVIGVTDLADPETGAVSPTISELTSNLDIVVTTFSIEFTFVGITIVLPFVFVEFLEVSFPEGAFSFD